jgi:hypothetical protein
MFTVFALNKEFIHTIYRGTGPINFKSIQIDLFLFSSEAEKIRPTFKLIMSLKKTFTINSLCASLTYLVCITFKLESLT